MMQLSALWLQKSQPVCCGFFLVSKNPPAWLHTRARGARLKIRRRAFYGFRKLHQMIKLITM